MLGENSLYHRMKLNSIIAGNIGLVRKAERSSPERRWSQPRIDALRQLARLHVVD